MQGFHDFVLFGSVAFASLMSGMVYNAWGWDMLNWMIFPVVLLCFAALGRPDAARQAGGGVALRPLPHLRASFKRLWRRFDSAAFPQIAA